VAQYFNHTRSGYLNSRLNAIPGRFGNTLSSVIELFKQRKNIWHNVSRGLFETGSGYVVFNERLWKSELTKMPPLTVLPGNSPVAVAGKSWISDVSSAERTQAGNTIPLHNFVWWKDYDGYWHFARQHMLPAKLAEAHALAHRARTEQSKPFVSSTSNTPQVTPLSSGTQGQSRSARPPQKWQTLPGPSLLRQLSQGLYEPGTFARGSHLTPGSSTLAWMAQGLMPESAHRPGSQLQLLKHALMRSFTPSIRPAVSHARPFLGVRPSLARYGSLRAMSRGLHR
jgi:hypothetical protein